MSKRSGLYPHVRVDAADVPAVAHAGGVLLTRTVRVSGLDVALREALRPWRKPLVRHDPAKVVTDLAVSLALGGDACRDAALLRAEPGVSEAHVAEGEGGPELCIHYDPDQLSLHGERRNIFCIKKYFFVIGRTGIRGKG